MKKKITTLICMILGIRKEEYENKESVCESN